MCRFERKYFTEGKAKIDNYNKIMPILKSLPDLKHMISRCILKCLPKQSFIVRPFKQRFKHLINRFDFDYWLTVVGFVELLNWAKLLSYKAPTPFGH